MVRLSLTHASSSNHVLSIPLGIGIFVMVSTVVALCANHVRRRSKKEESNKQTFVSIEDDGYQEKFPPRSPLRSPKQLITTISNKAMNSLVVNHKKGGGGDGDKMSEEGFGEGGLWQREILMGEKCQPPEFSGVIYYDCDGHRVSEFPPRSPRSPRITTPSSEFTFPMIKTPV